MNTNTLLFVGIGALGIYVLTRKAPMTGSAPPPAPMYAPPVYAPPQNQWGSSANPANLNNYYPSQAQDAAAVIGAIGSLAQAGASIYSATQQSSNSGYLPDGWVDPWA